MYSFLGKYDINMLVVISIFMREGAYNGHGFDKSYVISKHVYRLDVYSLLLIWIQLIK